MTTKETVHVIAVILWGLFGIVSSTVALVGHEFSYPLMVAIVSAIAGNSAHLITMALSKTGISVSSEKTS